MSKWSITIDSIPQKRIRFIKVIRKGTGATIKEATATYEHVIANLPCLLASDLERDDADRIAEAIRKCEAIVHIKPWVVTLWTIAHPDPEPLAAYKSERFGKRLARVRAEAIRRAKKPLFWSPLLVAAAMGGYVIARPGVLNLRPHAAYGAFLFGLLILFSAFVWVCMDVPRIKSWTCANCGHDLRGVDKQPKERCTECGSENCLPPGAPAVPEHVASDTRVLALFVIVVAGLWTLLFGYLLFGG